MADEQEPPSVDKSDGDMINFMSFVCQQQQVQLAEVMSIFLSANGKNLCEHLSEIKDAIVNNSRCILKLNETLDKMAKSRS